MRTSSLQFQGVALSKVLLKIEIQNGVDVIIVAIGVVVIGDIVIVRIGR